MLLALPAAAHGDGLGGSIGVATDDAYRGVSYSNDQLSPRGEFHGVLGPWFAGVSAEEIRRGLNRGAGAEVIAYIGYQLPITDGWSVQATMRHYDYPGNLFRAQYNYDELELSVGWQQRVVVSAIASPDTYSHDYLGNFGNGRAFAYEVAARQPLPAGLSALAGLGYYDLRHEIGIGYFYGSVGLERRWRSWAVDLRYVDTDGTAKQHFEDDARSRLVLSVFWTF
ncbi:MAG TPA: TorF family putative porin [Steroidobacteraceae bacterium]